MKKAAIDDKSKFYYAVVIALLLVAAAFFAGYRNLKSNTDRLNAENSSLESRIRELEQYYLMEEQNKADTEDMTVKIGEIFSEYPGDARYEDGIYEAFALYGGSFNTLQLTSIAFSKADPVKIISADTVIGAGIEEYTDEIDFNCFDVTYRGSLTYDGLKGTVEEISNGKYNLGIGQMAYAITDNGQIEGTTQLSFYSVDGANCDYSEPPVSEYETGIENLFGVNDISIGNP